MKRFDLRHLKRDFLDRMEVLIEEELADNEVGIFLFEVGDFTPVNEAHDLVKKLGHDLLNSLKFAEPDWTIVVRKLPEDKRAAQQTQDSAQEATQESGA